MKIKLAEYMYENNLTIRQVEYLTKIPKSTLSDILNHKVSPRMDTMEKLAAGLKIRISDLYESNYK